MEIVLSDLNTFSAVKLVEKTQERRNDLHEKVLFSKYRKPHTSPIIPSSNTLPSSAYILTSLGLGAASRMYTGFYANAQISDPVRVLLPSDV